MSVFADFLGSLSAAAAQKVKNMSTCMPEAAAPSAMMNAAIV
jgi:hypothetical protein